eukprot:Hpha_TRINITY_DN15262_c1_g10::TRINITY_DN15262_c1_g10_i1::g.64294::m.64294
MAALCVLLSVTSRVAAAACGGWFGDDMKVSSSGLAITVAEVGTGAGFPSSGGPVVHFASGEDCLDPLPSACERYFKWYYRFGCPALESRNITIGGKDGRRFDRNTGVLIECRPWAVDVKEFCYSPSGSGPKSCQCPATVMAPQPPWEHAEEESGSGSGSDNDADRVIFSDSPVTDIVAVILFPSIAAVATTAGVGGGGIFVPLLIIMCGFSAKAATGTSQALIFGACTAALSANIRRQHPKAKRPLIDYEMCLFLAPMEMAGALLGVIVNVMLPTWLLQALMFVVLAYTAWKTGNKGYAQYKKEKAAGAGAAPRVQIAVPAVTDAELTRVDGAVITSPMNTDDVEADVTLLGDLLRGSRYMVDIRDDGEREAHGAIISAQHAPMDEVLSSGLPDEVDKEAEIIVLGQEGGQRCQRVKDHLRSRGFANVKVLRGGMAEWNRSVPEMFGRVPPIPAGAFIGARELARRSLLGKTMPYAIDIRSTEEREADLSDEILKLTLPDNHVPAESMLREQEPRVPDCEKGNTILLVGIGHMQRAAKVYRKLQSLDFTDVRVLRGGLKAWRELVGGGMEYDDMGGSPRVMAREQWQIQRAVSAPLGSRGWGSTGSNPRDVTIPASLVPIPPPAPAAPKKVGFGLWARTPRTKEQILEQESIQFPKVTLAALFGVWVFLIALILVKGGKKTPSAIGLTNCSGGYWGVWFASQLFLIAVGTHYAMRAVVSCEEKQLCNFHFLPTDIMWTGRKTAYVCAYAAGAGVLAGIMGIGGGMVLGPLMLQLGVDGRVSSSTTTATIVMTSSSAVIAFFAAGTVPWTYALTLCCACFCGAFIGKRYLDAIVKKHNLTALIIILLAAIIGGSSLFVLGLGAFNWNDMRESGTVPGFNPPC